MLVSLLLAFFPVLACCAATKPDADKFKLEGTAEFERGTPIVADVDYTGALPAGANPLLNASSWRIFWTSKPDSTVHAADVVAVTVDAVSEKLRLQIAGDVPTPGCDWKVLFNPAGPPSFLPQVIDGTPTKAAPTPQGPAHNPPGPLAKKPEKKDCSNDNPDDQPFFCPASKGGPPDMSLTASFLAAGGTKPIYSLALKGALQLTNAVAGFHPGIDADVEINQDTKPPVNKTTFSPDSITAGLNFSRIQPVQHDQLYGIKLHAGLPDFEFSTSDPSTSIIVNPSAQFILNSWQPKSLPSLYGTFYPFLALELGENLSKPTAIESIPVDLSNYNTIVRGVLGADAALVTVTPDDKGTLVNTFSLTGSYRVRLPAFEEPEVRTLHQVTTVDLTTKARHWVEADANYAPWSFKFLAITAKYQYGELPPLFKLVDHCFTLGLTLQASQPHKKD